jgi:BASS family bile acid:Na+ symporter
VFGRGLIVVAGSLAVAAQLIFFVLITTLPYWIGFGLPHNQKIGLSCGMATRNLGVALAPLFSLVEVDQRAIVMVVLALPISIAFAFGAGWLFRPRADFNAS